MKNIERKELLSDPNMSLMFPDVATDGETVLCAFIKCRNHMSRYGARLCFCAVKDLNTASVSDPVEIESPEGYFYNSPRIVCPSRKHFLVCVDAMPLTSVGPDFMTEMGDTKHLKIFIFETMDSGKTWGVYETNAFGICPSIFYDKKIYLATQVYDPVKQKRDLMIFRDGKTEGNAFVFATVTKLEPPQKVGLCEATMAKEGDTFVLIARSNTGDGAPAYRSLSVDDGATWAEPEPFFIPGGGHRPTLIKLSTGDYFCSFRFFPGCGFDQNTMIALIPPYTLTAPRFMQKAILRPLDFNPNPQSDQGYTGACELPGGDVFVVNYMNPDYGFKTNLYCYRFGLDVFGGSFTRVLPEYDLDNLKRGG